MENIDFISMLNSIVEPGRRTRKEEKEKGTEKRMEHSVTIRYAKGQEEDPAIHTEEGADEYEYGTALLFAAATIIAGNTGMDKDRIALGFIRSIGGTMIEEMFAEMNR